MVHTLSRLRRGDDGAAAVLTALLAPVVFVGLCALVVDLGMARDTRRQAQNAADASVLAAGNVLYMNGLPDITAAVAAAKSYARKNYALKNDMGEVVELDWASCTDSAMLSYHPVDTACISFDSQTDPSAIRVSIPVRQVATPFAGIWGVSSVPVNAVAQISLSTGRRAVCGLCVVGPGTHDLGVGHVVATNADVMFNGRLSANNAGGSINVTNGNIYLDGPAPLAGTYSPAPQVNQPAVADPLATLSMPDYTGLTVKTNPCAGPPTGGPGIYSSLQGATSPACTMSPGLYVVTGPSSITGGDSIAALGVTMYFTCGTPAAPRTCNAGESGGDLKFSGNGTLTITAPTTGPTAGVSIISDRNNIGTFSYRGNDTIANTGTIYALNGTLEYKGNAGALVMDSLVVAGQVSFSGAVSDFTTSYTQLNNVAIPFSVLSLSK